MRPLFPLLVSALLSLPLPSTPSDRTAAPVLTLQQLMTKVERSTVLVTYPETGAVCTGFVVDAAQGWALTAQHCVVDEMGDLVVDGDVSKVLKEDGVFALVAVKVENRPPLEIRKDAPKPGAAVVSFGFGYGWMQVMPRYVSSLHLGDVFLDGTISPGMSGGPVVDYAGRVVGLNQATDPRFSLAQTCGAGEMLDFLKKR